MMFVCLPTSRGAGSVAEAAYLGAKEVFWGDFGGDFCSVLCSLSVFF